MLAHVPLTVRIKPLRAERGPGPSHHPLQRDELAASCPILNHPHTRATGETRLCWFPEHLMKQDAQRPGPKRHQHVGSKRNAPHREAATALCKVILKDQLVLSNTGLGLALKMPLEAAMHTIPSAGQRTRWLGEDCLSHPNDSQFTVTGSWVSEMMNKAKRHFIMLIIQVKTVSLILNGTQ